MTQTLDHNDPLMGETRHEEWTAAHGVAAGRQGWAIFDCAGSENGPFQVCAIAEPSLWADDFGFEPPTLGTDDAAVDMMRAAFQFGEPHAIAAHDFIRNFNPIEFAAFKMATWLVAAKPAE